MENKGFDQKADVYSFAMCLWEIFNCEEVFPHHRYYNTLTHTTAHSHHNQHNTTLSLHYSDYDEFMKAVCNDGERPRIPDTCLLGLRTLMEEAWQKEPSRRPDFTEINKRLNHILIETAIDDLEGQYLWRAKFLTAKKLQVRRERCCGGAVC